MTLYELFRIVEQLGGKLSIGRSGGITLAGISPNEPLRDKLLTVLRIKRDALTRHLTRPPLTVDEMNHKLESEIQLEHELDLFTEHDPTYKLESELATAALLIHRENQAVDDMRVDFGSLIPHTGSATTTGPGVLKG